VGERNRSRTGSGGGLNVDGKSTFENRWNAGNMKERIFKWLLWAIVGLVVAYIGWIVIAFLVTKFVSPGTGLVAGVVI
jgi:hypothetical protein